MKIGEWKQFGSSLPVEHWRMKIEDDVEIAITTKLRLINPELTIWGYVISNKVHLPFSFHFTWTPDEGVSVDAFSSYGQNSHKACRFLKTKCAELATVIWAEHFEELETANRRFMREIE